MRLNPFHILKFHPVILKIVSWGFCLWLLSICSPHREQDALGTRNIHQLLFCAPRMLHPPTSTQPTQITSEKDEIKRTPGEGPGPGHMSCSDYPWWLGAVLDGLQSYFLCTSVACLLRRKGKVHVFHFHSWGENALHKRMLTLVSEFDQSETWVPSLSPPTPVFFPSGWMQKVFLFLRNHNKLSQTRKSSHG